MERTAIKETSTQTVETWLISNTGVAARNERVYNPLTGRETHAHPNYPKFYWMENPVEHLRILRIQQSLGKPKTGTKQVLAIYEDKTWKVFRNMPTAFVPSISDKPVKL